VDGLMNSHVIGDLVLRRTLSMLIWVVEISHGAAYVHNKNESLSYEDVGCLLL